MRFPSLLHRPILRVLAASLLLSGAAMEANAVASDTPLNSLAQFFEQEQPADAELLEFAQGGCSAAAAQAAAETGGQVLSVQVADRGGRTVCIVTVLVPGKDGSRPRRQTITVPQ